MHEQFLLAPMGLLLPVSVHARYSVWPPKLADFFLSFEALYAGGSKNYLTLLKEKKKENCQLFTTSFLGDD